MNPAHTELPRVLVWDLPTRLFHWLLVASFAGAFLTAESESWRVLHVLLGYTALLLVAFRLVWGLVGSRYAKFSAFLAGPRSVAAYVRSLMAFRPEAHTGHNPAGGWAIAGLLSLTAAIGITGILLFEGWGPEAVEEIHEFLANATLGLVLVHVMGVIVGSMAHRENLVVSMVTGRKRAALRDAIRGPRPWAALALAVAVAVLWVALLVDGSPVSIVSAPPAIEHNSDDH